MRKTIILLLILCCPVLRAAYKDYFTSDVLRIDYFRTGNNNESIVSLHQLCKETPWAGSRSNLIDSLFYGEYRVEVYSLEGNKLLYAFGYSSLFREWQTTDEAKLITRSFPESVRVPFPRQKISVHFLSKRKEGQWENTFNMKVDPQDPYILDNTGNVNVSARIHGTADPAKALDLVILAEGYTRDQAKLFQDDALRFADYLLNAKPFNSYKDRINIRTVYLPSQDEGTDIPGEMVWKRTPLNTRFYTFTSERYLTTSDYHSVMDMASAVPWDQVFILVNTERYGGGGIYNFYSVCSARHPLSDFVFIHEFGHAFAGLGDEYYTSDVAYEGFYDLSQEPWEPNLTTLVNFDSKWKDMMPADTPVPTPTTMKYRSHIGVFEGGGYIAKGMYRPAYDCTMKSAKYDNFCLVCQRAISRMIQLYAE